MDNKETALKAKKKVTKRKKVAKRTSSAIIPTAQAQADSPDEDGPTPAGAILRLYCQGIGDCHLLRFPKEGGGYFHMLIDCGVHQSVKGGTGIIKDIVDDITTLTTHIDVVVGTHEHWDHISGFLSAAEQFKAISVGEIWLAWTENPHDSQAKAFDKYKGLAISALQGVDQRLAAAKSLSPYLTQVRAGIGPLLGFVFGAKGERVRSARDALVALAPGNVRYLEPKLDPLLLPGVSDVRVYVLGPPRDTKLFGILERESELYGLGSSQASVLAGALKGAFAIEDPASREEDWSMPFEPSEGADLNHILSLASGQNTAAGESEDGKLAAFLQDHYLHTRPQSGDSGGTDQEAWRRIDLDWLGCSAELAMQLDNRTNNTSLVLAIEFISSGRVMLFAADAQVGNWLSWQDTAWQVANKTVRGPDLLARTVFYKVGHHGSHNATLKKEGLEMMNSPDLTAFIPTKKADALKVGWGEMPFQDILEELGRRTSGRVIRADDPWVVDSQDGAPFATPSGSLLKVRHKQGLYVELEIG